MALLRKKCFFATGAIAEVLFVSPKTGFSMVVSDVVDAEAIGSGDSVVLKHGLLNDISNFENSVDGEGN
jgi:hypothetical protein